MSVDKLNLFYQVCGESNRVWLIEGVGKGGGGQPMKKGHHTVEGQEAFIIINIFKIF